MGEGMTEALTVQEAVQRRKQQRALRWVRREKMLQSLKDSGIPYRQNSETGPAAGIVYIDTGEGQLTLRLASWYWTCGESSGRGWASLLKKVKAGV